MQDVVHTPPNTAALTIAALYSFEEVTKSHGLVACGCETNQDSSAVGEKRTGIKHKA